MPHQCVKCSTTYDDDQMVMACSCGSQAFLFKRGDLEEPGLDGKYDIDLKALLKKEVVSEEDEGKYNINLHEGLKRLK